MYHVLRNPIVIKLRDYLPHWGTFLAAVAFFFIVPRFDWSWPFVFLAFLPFHWALNQHQFLRNQIKESLWLMLAWGMIAYSWMPAAASQRWEAGQAAAWILFLILCPLLNSLLLLHVIIRNFTARYLSGVRFAVASAASFCFFEYFLIYMDIKVGDYFYTNPALLSWARIGGASILSFVVVFFSELANLDLPLKKYYRTAGFLFFFLATSYLLFFLQRSSPVTQRIPVNFLHMNRSHDENNALVGTGVPRDYSSLDRHLSLLRESRLNHPEVKLTILPEAFFSSFSVSDVEALKRLEAFKDLIPDAPGQIAFGALIPEGKLFLNTLTAASKKDGKINYIKKSKRRPMPLGETIPLVKYLPWLQKLFFEARQEKAVEEFPMLFHGESYKWGGVICNEIFHSDLSVWNRKLGASFGVSIGNEVWVSKSAQRFLLAATAMRAAEMGMPYLKVANAGISVLVDGSGSILRLFPPGEEAVYNVIILVSSSEPSFYARFPYWFLSLCGFITFLSLFYCLWKLRVSPQIGKEL